MLKIKKVFASVVAAATMAVGMGGLSGAAYNRTEPWESRHVNVSGTPSSADYDAVRSIVYSTYGAICYCNAVSNTVNGGTGKTTITSVNGTMTSKIIYNTGSAVCKPTLEGEIECATYKMSASTTTSGNIYISSGNIVTKTTK